MGTVCVQQTVIDKSQPEEIYQVVGFSEYDTALHYLDRFVALSLPEELEVVDDILATGGTIVATIKLLEQLGAVIVGVVVLRNLTELEGYKNLAGYKLISLLNM